MADGNKNKQFVVVAVATTAAVAAVATLLFVRHRQRQAALALQAAKQCRIVIPKPQEFRAKRNKIIAGGFKNLQVISDFDNTLTTAFVGTARSQTAYGILETSSTLSANFRAKSKENYARYHPLEISHDLTVEEKIPIMVEWYTTVHNELVKERFDAGTINEAVRNANTQLRPGARDVIRILQAHAVPLLVFSAGVGNIIEDFLQQRFGVLADSTHIIANWLKFDSNGTPTFKPPLIHMFNKDERHTKGTSFAQSVVERKNVILLGDGLGDATMASGVSHDVVLRIGFLNHNPDHLLPQFSEVYDAIVLDDGPMEIVVSMLKSMETD